MNSNKLPTYLIPKLVKSKNYAHSSNLLLKWELSETNESRGQVIVSQKVEKTAVMRNKMKRKLRTLIAQNSNINKGIDYILIAKKGAGEISHEKLEVQASKLFKNISYR